jgi:hypothetical protein
MNLTPHKSKVPPPERTVEGLVQYLKDVREEAQKDFIALSKTEEFKLVVKKSKEKFASERRI